MRNGLPGHNLSPFYIEFCFIEAFRSIPKIYIEEVLFNSSVVKAYNIIAIHNIKLDIEALDKFAKGLSNNYPGFDELLLPIKYLINLFYTKNIEKYLALNDKLESFFKVKDISLCKFLMRYKDLKKSSMNGRITENDMQVITKKLKERIKVKN